MLTLHLKRFEWYEGGYAHKIQAHVVFGEQLNLAAVLRSPDSEEGSEQLRAGCCYRLMGIVEHKGSMDGGHYVAYVRNGEGSWYYVSDESVSRCGWEQVAKADAFLLFYARVAPPIANP